MGDRLLGKKQMAALCIDTALTPCSVEFCPSQPQLGTCGQYQTQQLDEQQAEHTSDQSDFKPKTSDSDCPEVERVGRCILFEAQLDHQAPKQLSTQTASLDPSHLPSVCYQQLQSIDCPAILDQRWTHEVEQPILITADSQGDLNSYKFKKQIDHSSKPQLELIQTLSCGDRSNNKSCLCLAIDISDKKYRTPRPRTVCSLSNGEIVLFEQDLNNSQLNETNRWLGHDFEPWTCGFDYWQPNTILTGGDDCKLKVWDSRNSLSTPVMVNKRFDGGVTAIRSHHLRENIFAVGSYDSGLRIFDKRNFKSEVLKYNAEGGIWRIKWHESDYSQVLLATMHDGFKVLSIVEQEGEGKKELYHKKSEELSTNNTKLKTPKVVAILKYRSGLAYGADWGPPFSCLNKNVNSNLLEPIKGNLIGSCSFYDRVLHFWFAV